MSAPSIAELKARAAALHRYRGPGDPELAQANEALRSAVLDKWAEEVVQRAGELSPERRIEFGVKLIRAGGAAA